MSYPGMDQSLMNFVEEMSPKKGDMPYEGKPQEFRKKMAKKAAKLIMKRPNNLYVKDFSLETPFGKVNCRKYVPHKVKKPSPALIYMHGGGWIIGDLNSHDAVCVDLALHANIVVISLEYALAPENKFPTALNQCTWVFSEIKKKSKGLELDPDYLSIGGDSAGGNLALATSLSLRNRNESVPFLQFLIYPCISTNF